MEIVAPEWTWLMVVGVFAAVVYGWGTGANDVANAFGTSVGAKTLTLRQAVLLAAIFEFAGALLLGRVTTNVIQGSIASLSTFQREPAIYAYGMVCALAMGGIWQGIASYYEWNVSATHSIIGAIIGFSLAYGGGGAVNWATPAPGSIPPYSGVVPIVCAWIFSPILTALCSATILFLIRTFILRRQNPAKWSLALLPFSVFITAWICVYFTLTRGARRMLSNSDWDETESLWVSAVAGAGLGVLTAVIAVPLLWRRILRQFDENSPENQAAATATAPKDLEADVEEQPKTAWGKLVRSLTYGTSVDIHDVVEEDEITAAIHQNAEEYDPKAEAAFAYLQVFSAICVIFSHGAGEVGQITGPLGAVWQVYTTGRLQRNIDPPIWMILIGAGSLVLGLATFGYGPMRAMGVRLAKLSPVRGFAAELATAFTIMMASQYGLPTSSSQVVTGGIIGVGLLEGAKGVNFKVFGKQFTAWVMTLVIMGGGTAALFAQAVYSPSVPTGKVAIAYETAITNMTSHMLTRFNTTLYSFKPAVEANSTSTLTLQNWQDYNASIANAVRAMRDLPLAQSNPPEYLRHLYQALALYQNTTIFTLGQNTVVSSLYSAATPICNTNVTTNATRCPAPSLVPSGISPRPRNVTTLP